jgi:hypothetical protein
VGRVLIEGRGVLSDGRGTPPSDGRGVLSDGRGTPPNEGLGTPPSEGFGVLVPAAIPSPAPPGTTFVEPKSPDPTLDVHEYVRMREREGGYFLGVSGRGGSDLSTLHIDGVVARDGIGESGQGLEFCTEERGLGLSGVAGKGRDNEDVDAVLLGVCECVRRAPELACPLPVPTPLELDPSLSRNTVRVGVTPSLANSSCRRTPPLVSSLLARALEVRPLRGRLLLPLMCRLLLPLADKLLHATCPNSSAARSSSPSSSRRTE